MNTQISLRLPGELVKEVEWVSLQMQKKRSEIVRIALQQFLKSTKSITSNTRPIDKIKDLLGCFNSGINDLGEKHRKYLTRIIKRGR